MRITILLVSWALLGSGAAAESGAVPTPRVPIEAPAQLKAALLFGAPAAETAPDLGTLNRSKPPRDPWLAYDKLQHVTFGLLGTLSGQYIWTQKAGMSASSALGLSVGVSAAAGVGKELYDRRSGRIFSVRDLVADALGIGLAAGIVVL